MRTKRPILIDLNGHKTLLAEHPGYLRSCSTVGSGEEILFHYNLAENAAPYNLVRIINAAGRVVVEKRLDVEGDVEFTVSGKQYRVRIPSPELPG
jgi:hypothetical protein